jgi:adenine-specific DNA-methyltransferase
LPEFEGKINCIYIDPPYNTGEEKWEYNDNVNDPKIKKWLGKIVGKEGEDLSRHDKWLCMMYPRLKLLQRLLHKDGSMVISIGHQELFNLMLVVRELFNGVKQIVCVTVQTSGGKPSGSFNYQHEYLVFILPNDFEPNAMNFTGGKERTPFEGLTLATFDKTQRPNQTYPIFINTLNGNIASIGHSLHERIKCGTFTGELSDFEYDFNEAPAGTVAIWPITSKGKDCVWRLAPNRLLSDWEKGYIKVTPNRNKLSKNQFSIQYLPEGVIKKIEKGVLEVVGKDNHAPTLLFGNNETSGSDIPTLWLEKDFHSVKGTTLLSEIFDTKVFSYPKPLALITEILTALTNDDDIVLDSFAGSASTAHAVLNLNNNDGGNRRFILIETMDYAETVTAERVRRVINGYGEGDKAVAGTGGSFDFYIVGAPLFNDDKNLNEEVGEAVIRDYVAYSERIPAPAKCVSKDGCDSNHIAQKVSPHSLGVTDTALWVFYYDRDRITTLDLDFLGTLNINALHHESKTRPELFIIYADKCALPIDFLYKHGITFKRIPRDITRF